MATPNPQEHDEATPNHEQDEQPPTIHPKKKADLLQHPVRSSIVEILDATPGLNQNQLAKKLGKKRNTIQDHIDTLLDNDLICRQPSAQDQEHLLFLPHNVKLWNNPQTRILFGRKPKGQIAQYIAENPGSTSTQIAEAFDRHPATIVHHLQGLQQSDLLDLLITEDVTAYYPLPVLQGFASDVGHRFEAPWKEG